MTSAIDRLSALRVRDVMSTQIVCVRLEESMAGAAVILNKYQISGAPVVDHAGRCVGVITAADFVRREAALAAGECESRWSTPTLSSSSPAGAYQVSDIRCNSVADWMSTGIQTIDADKPLSDAAHEMCLTHYHRLYVLDQQAHPVGALTTLDVAAAMVDVLDNSKGVR